MNHSSHSSQISRKASSSQDKERSPKRKGHIRGGNAHKKASITRESDPVRDLAFDILCGVMEERRMLETTLDKSKNLEGRDRAAGHRLAAATLRHWGSMNEIISPLLRREPPEIVRCALLMGVAQLLYLETPPHAAVGTIVDLLHRRKLSPFAGLANAVLRNVIRQGDSLTEGLDKERLDVPSWLWTSWGKRARSITKGFYQEAALDVSYKENKAQKEEIAQACQEAGGQALPNGVWRFPAGTRMTSLYGFEEGLCWAQDFAASMIVPLMGDIQGKKIADLCAAPGGKTFQLLLKGAFVTAVERDAVRAERLRENLKRLALETDILVQDALEFRPKEALDAVLLDAPCSATGTLRRHPDVLWVKRQRDVVTLAAGQDNLIDAAQEMLKTGGMLLYAVCSLQDEEGPLRIQAALERGGWVLSPFTEEELASLPQARTQEGYYRTHPGMFAEKGGMDGFFAARLIKK